MARKIGYRVSEPIDQYVSGEIDKSKFKQKVKNVERAIDGANWWTIATAVHNETDEPHHLEVAEPLSELYDHEDLARVFGNNIIDQI